MAVVATLVLLISHVRGDPGEERLVLLGTYHSTGDALDVEGDFAYVGSHGIEVYDVTRTSNMWPVDIHYMDGFFVDVVLDGSLLYATHIGMGVFVFDVSNPLNVTEVSHPHWADYNRSVYYGIDRFDDFLCVGTGNYGPDGSITILDVSDPVDVTFVSTLTFGSFVSECEYWNGYLYVLAGLEGLRVLDVSDPYNPQEVGHLDTEGRPFEITFLGSTAYLADYDGGLLILDMSDPLNPADTWYRYEYGTKVYSVFPTDELLFVGDEDGLRVYDRMPQRQIAERDFYDFNREVNDIEVIGSRVYTMDGGFSIFEFQEPEDYILNGLPFFLLPAAFAAVIVAALWWRYKKGGEAIPPKRL